jgi:hypothetical protein
VGVRGQVGSRPRGRVPPGRSAPADVADRPGHHPPVPGTSRAGHGTAGRGGRVGRRAGVPGRGGPAVVRAAAAPHARRRPGRDPPPGRPLPRDIHGLRPAARRRSVPARPALRGAADAAHPAQPDRAGLADPTVLDRGWHRHPGRDRRARSGRDHRQAPHLDLPAGPSVSGLAEDQEHPDRRRSDRRLVSRRRSPRRHHRLVVGRSAHSRRSGLYRQRRYRPHRRRPPRPPLPPQRTRNPQLAVRRSPRAAGVRPLRPAGSDPELAGEVAYAEIGLEGRLRHPRWRGLREG